MTERRLAPRRVWRGLRALPRLLRLAVVKGWQDRLLGLSAEAAFWQLLSLPSLFLALVATLGYVSRWFGPHTVDRVEAEIEHALSHAFSQQVVTEVIAPTLNEILHSGRADVISIGFVLALWAGSSATATYVNTTMIAYDMRDLRGPVRSRLLALGLFLGTMLLGVVLLPMMVLGPGLIRRTLPHGVRHTFTTLIDGGYYPVLILLLLGGLTTFYKLAPPRRLPWHRGLPGAVFALVIFLGGSIALRAYVEFILDHNHAYGTLAAPIAALLFFFVLALGVLLGAELNAVIQQHVPARAAHHPHLDVTRLWTKLGGGAGAGCAAAASTDGADHRAVDPAAAAAPAGPVARVARTHLPRRAAGGGRGQSRRVS